MFSRKSFWTYHTLAPGYRIRYCGGIKKLSNLFYAKYFENRKKSFGLKIYILLFNQLCHQQGSNRFKLKTGSIQDVWKSNNEVHLVKVKTETGPPLFVARRSSQCVCK